MASAASSGRALARLDDQDYLNAFRRRTENLIRDSASDNYLAAFDFDDAELIREVILLDRQMVAHYEKLESQAFEALDTERKIDAVDQWLGSTQALRQRLAALQSRMETWPELTSRRFAPDRIASKFITGK